MGHGAAFGPVLMKAMSVAQGLYRRPRCCGIISICLSRISGAMFFMRSSIIALRSSGALALIIRSCIPHMDFIGLSFKQANRLNAQRVGLNSGDEPEDKIRLACIKIFHDP